MVVDSDAHLTSSMRRVMKMMNREGGPSLDAKPDLELNPSHPMLVQLEKIRHTDAALAGEVGEQIFDNALVAAGLMDDPRTMLARMNSLLEQLLKK